MIEVVLIYPTFEGSQEIPVKGEKLSLGRTSEAEFVIPDSGLSRLNSTIYCDGKNAWIVDENSTNGTFINGSPAQPGGTPLRNGDSIKIGNETTLRVRIAEKQAYQAAASAPVQNTQAAAPITSVSSTSSNPSWMTILPIALTAFALFVISVSAVFIGFKVFAGEDTPVVQNIKEYDTPDDEADNTNDNKATPKPTKTPKGEKTPPGSSSNDNTALTNTPETQTTSTPIALPSGKKYLEMSEPDKKQYIQVKAEKVASLIGNRTGNPITPLAIDRIKGFLDGYARRGGVARAGGCKFGDNLMATYERASKNAPFIIRAFNERGVDPQIGLYLAMIESEHCICLQSPTGPLGMYQFTFLTAKAHFRATDSIVKGASPSSPDDRCKPEPAANAAAEYMKFLTGRYGTGPASVPLAIGSYNSGEGGLSSNLKTAMESNESLPRDFWALIANGDKLSKQFQAENFKYVPKFFAAAIVGENPRDFGLNLEPLSTYTK